MIKNCGTEMIYQILNKYNKNHSCESYSAANKYIHALVCILFSSSGLCAAAHC